MDREQVREQMVAALRTPGAEKLQPAADAVTDVAVSLIEEATREYRQTLAATPRLQHEGLRAVDSPTLPPFPVDDATLDLLVAATTTPSADGSSTLSSTLDLLAGIDPDDRSMLERVDDDTVYDPRDHYTEHCVILALIDEVRAVRLAVKRVVESSNQQPCARSELCDEGTRDHRSCSLCRLAASLPEES